MTKKECLGTSTALGFWSKHAEIMDVICEIMEDERPRDELIKDRFPPNSHEKILGNFDVVSNICTHAERDSKRLIATIKQSLERRIPSPYKTTPRGSLDEWSTAIRIPYHDGRSRQIKDISIGCYIDNSLNLICWVWSPSSALRLEELMRTKASFDPSKKLQEEVADKDKKTVILSKIPLSGDSSFTVSLDQVLDEALSSFKWIRKKALDDIFALQRPS